MNESQNTLPDFAQDITLIMLISPKLGCQTIMTSGQAPYGKSWMHLESNNIVMTLTKFEANFLLHIS